MTWGLIRPFNKYIFNLPTSTHDCCSLSLWGRECGKALTLPLKLVMETCSWGQRMDWAWQPISSRKPFSGGAEAARCDPMRLSAGGKALADGPNGRPRRLLRPHHAIQPKAFSRQRRGWRSCRYEGMKNRDLRLRLFFGQRAGLLMPHGLYYLSQHHAT